MVAAWSTPADVEAKVRRRWSSGELLRSHAEGQPFGEVDVALRGPTARTLGEDLDAVRAWMERLEAGAIRAGRRRYHLETKEVGGRLVGRNRLPSRARVTDYDEAWALLGVVADVAAFDAVRSLTASDAEASAWVLQQPLRAIELAPQWPTILTALSWLREHRGSGSYLRQVDAPGVDTKFVEQHRGLLAQVLDVPRGSEEFLRTLGLADRPATVRMRVDDGFAGLPRGVSEVTLRLAEASRLQVSVSSAVIIENEISYLSAPVPHHGVVIFGEGFRVNRAGSLPWLVDAAVWYWGDLDTHGFAILDRLRAWLPRTRSVLMDADTLLAHRDRWGREPTPTSAALTRLTAEERAVYDDLVTDRHAERLRLEQERIDWGWVEQHWPDV